MSCHGDPSKTRYFVDVSRFIRGQDHSIEVEPVSSTYEPRRDSFLQVESLTHFQMLKHEQKRQETTLKIIISADDTNVSLPFQANGCNLSQPL
jgi:hypothetical protein